MKSKISTVQQLLFAICLLLLIAPNHHSNAQGKQKSRGGKTKSLSPVSIVNFNEAGKQVTRFDVAGDAVDAHDGEIAYFDGTYYLYGTSYDCGFAWQNKSAPFCGFKVYASPDLVNWTDKGYLFDAKNPVWQSRCNGSTYGCFRPHVIFNKQTGLYVLWVNVYDNRVGFRVFTSTSPAGPFTEVDNPTLAVNNDADVAGLNNGDHDTFVDEDGKGYVAYTDWRTKGTIVIEELTPDFLSGTGRHVKAVTPGKTEAPGLMKRNGIYYLLYSDPNCGYCSGTGTSYRTAKSPLGPWSEGIRISDKSCGGQPSFVSTIQFDSETVYIYGSDLWNNAARNEALANYFWAPLKFTADGAIEPIPCNPAENIRIRLGEKSSPANLKKPDISSGLDGFTRQCDIANGKERSQSFTATKTGKLTSVNTTTFRDGDPDAGLTLHIYRATPAGLPEGKPLFSTVASPDSIGWAAKRLHFAPNIPVEKGGKYAVSFTSATTKGCYGFQFNDTLPYSEGAAAVKTDGAFVIEKDRSLKFETYISK
ncbi:family 43 glycosylhydrolase [Dyadobacter sp.]|uniref:family 43 glycosylhydrolase n=1 Tax=Dyadobacter sp. TaxID=1914288 RepID=UPI003F711CA5